MRSLSNVPSARAAGSITIDRGSDKRVRKTFSRAGGMCPHCEGRGTVSDIELTQLFDDSKSLAEGAITIPGYKKGGWAVRPSLTQRPETTLESSFNPMFLRRRGRSIE